MANYSDEHRKELASHDLPVEDLPRFVEAPGFSGLWAGFGLTDPDLHVLQATLAARPTAGPVVSGTNGVRKPRSRPPSQVAAGAGLSGSSILSRWNTPLSS